MKKSKARFWIFLAPALISFSLVVLIPMLIGFFYAFTCLLYTSPSPRDS